MAIRTRYGAVPAARIDWRQTVEVEYQFLTDVITSRDGTEMRSALRSTARISVSHAAMFTSESLQRFHADIAMGQGGSLYTVPVGHRTGYLQAQASAGSAFLVMADTPFWVEAGAHLVIEDATQIEAVEIASVAGMNVSLTAPLAASFAAGSKVMLGYQARMQNRVTVQARTASVWDGYFVWDVDPGSDPQAAPAASPQLFEDVEVFLTAPNWRESPRLEFEAMQEIADADRGIINVTSPWAFNPQSEQLLFSGRDRDEAEDLIGFFLRMKGKRTSFWMPTRMRDIKSASTEAPGSSVFTVAGSDFETAFSGSVSFNVVAAIWPDGSVQLNRIVSMAPSGPDTEVTFTDAWDNEVTPTTLLSWCPRWRFVSDDLSVRWLTDAVAEMQFNIRQIMS